MAPFISGDAPTNSSSRDALSNSVNGHMSASDSTMPIAIVGMGCRCAGDATNPETLWDMCADGREAWNTVPKERYNSDAFYHPDPARNGTSNARDYETLPIYQATGSGPSLAFLSNRLSYFYDLKGPSVTVDTACSASLVALHLACETLRSGESKRAVVGGSNVILSHEIMISMTMMRFLSTDGRCYSFDHRANGYARGEGAACLILKPLKDAVRDGDTIRGVIRNTGINQDGKTSGITLPSGEAQEALIRSVYKGAGLNPLETSFVECHGTGTPAGDPLEAGALAKVFAPGRSSGEPLRIGSIKSNMGHLEGASGLAGLIKTILMLENKLILPNRNFEKGNPRIPFADWKLKVPTSLEEWKAGAGVVRRASINSFGYGGTNAHVIIDDAPSYLSARGIKGSYRKSLSGSAQSAMERNGHMINGYANEHLNGQLSGQSDKESTQPKGLPRIFTLRAFDEVAGKQQGLNLAAFLKKRSKVSDGTFMDDLAFTLNERRTNFQWKATVTANSIDELITGLETNLKFVKAPKAPNLGFVFTGQGAQWNAMGRELIDTYPIFKQSLIRSNKTLSAIGAPWSLLEELSRDAKSSRVGIASISQPACTAIQIALVDLYASWNIKPISVTGHSSGEIAAAYAMGAVTQEAAIAISYYRGVVAISIKDKSPILGAMLAVGMSKSDVEPIISALAEGKARVACENSPSSITVSGDKAAIDELQAVLDERKVFARKLAVDVAYHSHHMNLVADEYLAAMKNLQLQETGDIEFHSSVTGERIDSSELGPQYWVANMVSQVRFAESLRSLCLNTSATKRRRPKANAGIDVLLEIGPHAALAGPIKQILQSDSKLSSFSTIYVSALLRKESAVLTSLALASQLFRKGLNLDFSAINRPTGLESRSVLVDLPPYAWNHSNSFWDESRISRTYRQRLHPRNDLLGVIVSNSNPLEPRWRNPIRAAEIPWVRDHKVQSNIVYPAAGYLIMAIEAASQRANDRGISVTGFNLREITIGQALIVPEYSGENETIVCLRPYNESARVPSDIWDEFCIYSTTEDNNWTEHCRGLISTQKESTLSDVDGVRQAEQQQAQYSEAMAAAEAVCKTPVDTVRLYEHLKDVGLEYGPTFANMTKAFASPNNAIGTIAISDTAAVMPSNFQFPF
ncbi:MAG: hypothetical protein Q9214_003767, partial [Letrouitia sp. 1 TL-2023]